MMRIFSQAKNGDTRQRAVDQIKGGFFVLLQIVVNTLLLIGFGKAGQCLSCHRDISVSEYDLKGSGMRFMCERGP